jgi:hypothetical protein
MATQPRQTELRFLKLQIDASPRLFQKTLAQRLVYPKSFSNLVTNCFFHESCIVLKDPDQLHHLNEMGASEAGPGVGFEFPSFEVAWKKRDLLLFAASIGATYPDELHFLYVSFSST